MNTQNRVLDQSTAAVQSSYITGSVNSKDGTLIGYRQLGHGPGLVLLHGAMESAQSHMQLAEALADTFTVYLPDRRGRGLSGPYGNEYRIEKNVEDLDALLIKTSAHYIFGVSSGGTFTLQASLALPAIHKIALYEPALVIHNPASLKGYMIRLDREIAEGKVVSALITGMKGTQMGPPIFHVMPRWLLELLIAKTIESEDKQARDGDVTMRMLAPTLRYDFQLVEEMSEKVDSFRAVHLEVLLLGGNKSQAYLKTALDTLETVLPNVKQRIEFPGLNHSGSGNRESGGQPQRVAQELRQFFRSG